MISFWLNYFLSTLWDKLKDQRNSVGNLKSLYTVTNATGKNGLRG
jgi:hypothetical protein